MNSELLRESLRSHADEAPPGTALLDAVRTRSRRIRRRRQLTVTGAALVAVVAVVAVAVTGSVVLWQPADQPARPAAAETEEPAEDAEGTDGALEPPSYELPDFPFTPGAVPEGLGEGWYYYSSEYLELTHAHPDSRTTFMSVRIHSEDPSRWFATVGFDVAEQDTTVRGQDAMLATGVSDESVPDEVPDNRVAAVSWSYEPGRWVSVLGHNGFGADEVLRYAEELTEQPFPAQPAFTFDLLPPGAEPTSVTSSGMSFAPAGAVDFRQDGMPIPRELVVRLRRGPVDEELVFDCYSRTEDYEQCEDLAREPVQVGDHDGELVGTDTVVVYLGDEVSLTVTVGGDFSLGREDLLRLAAGIHLTEYAQPAGGA